MSNNQQSSNEIQLCLSMEDDSQNGARKFISTTFTELLHVYFDMIPSTRHFYEIIREDTPCRLYLDLEYERGENFNKTKEEEGVSIVTWFVSASLRDMYSILVHRSDFFEIDSSTPKKFSRHLVLHFPSEPLVLFSNNLAVGSVVVDSVNRMIKSGEVRNRDG